MAQWHTSNFPGVRYRKHSTRKHGVKHDQYFSIRYQIDGKRQEEGLGWASEGWTAQKAYNQLTQLKESAKTGTGPTSLQEKRRDKALQNEAQPTLDDCVVNFIAECQRTKRPKTIRCYSDGLKKVCEYVPAQGTGKLGNWKLDEIKRRHLSQIIANVSKDSPSTAIQVRAALSALYTWAVQSPREYIEANIIRDIPRPQKPSPRERYLTGTEARILWEALHSAQGDPVMVRCVQLTLLTGCRISEASGMMSNEIDGHWWTIPSSRTKSKRPHRVFLTDTALKIIGTSSGLIFPSTSTQNEPKAFDTSSFSRWVRRQGFWGLEKFSIHDLRRTVASALAEAGFSQDVIGACIGHRLHTVTAQHYVRHQYDKEKQQAFTRWESYLTGKGSAKVIQHPRSLAN